MKYLSHIYLPFKKTLIWHAEGNFTYLLAQFHFRLNRYM